MISPLRPSALRAIQRSLEQYYGLEGAPDVVGFVLDVEPDQREAVYVRDADDAVEVAVLLPRETPETLDGHAQLVEGVSHFLYLAERARTELPATRLELELQAEVDKFVVLAAVMAAQERRHLHRTLFEQVRYLHDATTERGERYRLANGLAARLVARVATRHGIDSARGILRRFYRAGQAEKIRMARAA